MTLRFGLLLFPNLTQLDLTGPLEVFAKVPDAKTDLVWKTLEPVEADCGVRICPTKTLEDCPELDVLCVPGGVGQIPLMQDEEVLAFLRRQGAAARYVTSVCTGAFLLGAAGLLEGYDATTHWAYMQLLPAFGAKPVSRRVVTDRNRLTGGGVTAGIDLGLELVGKLCGDRMAQEIQLSLEYNPSPPFDSGHPSRAPEDIVASTRARFQRFVDLRLQAIETMQARRAAG